MNTREAIFKAAAENDCSRFTMLRLRFGMMRPRVRREIELCLADAALRAGVIPPQSIGDDGTVGDWTDFFDWFIENWPAILDMIMQIIQIFSMFG